jgi:hypothetical protein
MRSFSKAGVAVEHRVGAPDEAIALLQDGGRAGDLQPPGLTGRNAAAEARERLAEKGANEVGLEPASLRPLHLLTNCGDVARVHAFAGQLPLGDETADLLDVDHALDLPEQGFRASGASP